MDWATTEAPDDGGVEVTRPWILDGGQGRESVIIRTIIVESYCASTSMPTCVSN